MTGVENYSPISPLFFLAVYCNSIIINVQRIHFPDMLFLNIIIFERNTVKNNILLLFQKKIYEKV